MRLLLIATFLSAALSVQPLAAAEPLAQLPGLIREPMTVNFADGVTQLKLEALMTRPAQGRAPLIILSHGAPRDAADRPTMRPASSAAVAIAFAERGWAVLSVMRRGYGRSEGRYGEGSGSCTNPNYVSAGRASAMDLIQAIGQMAHLSYIDASRVMLVGVSAGGFASVAAAAQAPEGVIAVLNFAGGRGSTGPDKVCREDALVDAFGQFGRTVHVPVLSLYAANDHFFGPALARRAFDAFRSSGAPAEFVALPGFGEDGHQLFTDAGMPLWRAPVDQFLQQHHLPDAVTAGIAIPDLPPPPGLGAAGLESFKQYRASLNFEKAFAIARGGPYAWRTGQRSPAEAGRAALEACATHGSGCVLYAVNNDLVR